MAISFVNYASDTTTTTSPCRVPKPSGLTYDDILICFTPGTGGSGAHGTGTVKETDLDRYYYFPGFSGGYVGNVFNIHDGVWTRVRNDLTTPTYIRNYSGGGLSLAYRGIRYFTMTDPVDSGSFTGASGTMTLPLVTSNFTDGYSLAIFVAHQFKASGDPAVSFTWPATTTLRATFSTASEYWEVADIIQSVDDWPAVSVSYTGQTVSAFHDVHLSGWYGRYDFTQPNPITAANP